MAINDCCLRMRMSVSFALRFEKSALLQRANCVRHGRKKALTIFFVRAFLAVYELKKGSALFKQGKAYTCPRPEKITRSKVLIPLNIQSLQALPFHFPHHIHDIT